MTLVNSGLYAEAADLFRVTAKSVSWHSPAEADEHLGGAYRSLLSFKGSLDQMEEIPQWLMPLYKECGKALSAVEKARKSTYQLRMMTQRASRR